MCYVVNQDRLVFGSDRAVPVPFRPAVSLARTGALFVVLPSTTKKNAGFFRLEAGTCFEKRQRAPSEKRTGYLTPRYETVHRCDAREVGVLPHGQRVAIAEWLDHHWEGQA
jgi:hypothetical protein